MSSQSLSHSPITVTAAQNTETTQQATTLRHFLHSIHVPFLYFALYHGETSPRSPITGQGSLLMV
jgi:hypothetical protein